MAHLVASITEPRDMQVTTEQIHSAHDFLVEAAKASVTDHRLHATEAWGQSTKRDKVILPAGPRPALICKKMGEHSFAEVVNQCATIERLLDALAWAKTAFDGYFADYTVTTCHPTTGSVRSKEQDHDLILSGPDGSVALFEVSDVAISKDGNGKELRDVRLLLPDLDGPSIASVGESSEIRRFLVVSKEFSERLSTVSTQNKYRDRLFYYGKAAVRGTTVIVEVFPGVNPGLATVPKAQAGPRRENHA